MCQPASSSEQGVRHGQASAVSESHAEGNDDFTAGNADLGFEFASENFGFNIYEIVDGAPPHNSPDLLAVVGQLQKHPRCIFRILHSLQMDTTEGIGRSEVFCRSLLVDVVIIVRKSVFRVSNSIKVAKHCSLLIRPVRGVLVA